MVIPATIGSSLLGAVNGYLLSKWKFRGSDVIFTLILFGMFIPYQAILIPLIRTLRPDWTLREVARADSRPHHLWYPDHIVDLPQLLRKRSD